MRHTDFVFRGAPFVVSEHKLHVVSVRDGLDRTLVRVFYVFSAVRSYYSTYLQKQFQRQVAVFYDMNYNFHVIV